MERQDGAFTYECGVFIEGEGPGEFLGAGMDFGVVEEVAPQARGQLDRVRGVVAIDGGDQEVISEEVMVAAPGGLDERGCAVVGFDDVGVEVGDEFCVEPGEFADDLEFLGGAQPESSFSVAAVEEEAGEAGELCPADVEARGDGSSAVVTADIGADDGVAAFGAEQDIADSGLEAAAAEGFEGEVFLCGGVLSEGVFRLPGMGTITDPGDRGSVERGEAFGVGEGGVDGADERDEVRVLGEAVLVFVAGVEVHVAAGGHPSLICFLVGEGDCVKESGGEEGVSAVQFPSVDAEVEGGLLHGVPPGERLGVGVIEEGAVAFPPFELEALAGEVAVRAGIFEPAGVCGDGGILVGRIDHAGHPEDDTVALVLEVGQEVLGVAVGIELEIVVAGAPGAIDEDRADGDIVGCVALEQFRDGIGGIGVIFPEPAFEGPWWGDGGPGVALGVEGNSPEGEYPEEEDGEEEEEGAAEYGEEEQAKQFSSREFHGEASRGRVALVLGRRLC